MHKHNLLELARVAEEASKAAGLYLRDAFGTKSKTVSIKNSDIKLQEDIKANEIIEKIIKQTFPSHSIASEETSLTCEKREVHWIIDPMDGTNNFYSGIPYFSTSITIEIDCVPVIGVVFDPIRSRMYRAISGKGAVCNGEAIIPSTLRDSSKGVVSLIRAHASNDSEAEVERSFELERTLQSGFRRVIKQWAPALDWCLLASGYIDAVLSIDSEIEDQYAGTLIAREAGCRIVALDGDAFNWSSRSIYADNTKLDFDVSHLKKMLNTGGSPD